MDREDSPRNSTAPRAIKAAACTLRLLALVPFAVPVVWIVQRSEGKSAVAAVNPSLSDGTVDGIINGTIIGSLAILLAIAALYIWWSGLLRKGEKRARIALSALLVVTAAAGWLFSEISSHLIPTAMAYVMAEEGASLVLRIVALCLIWLPASSSKFFAPAQPRAN
jgi:hypothetical protein